MTRVHIIGTGISALTLARTLLKGQLGKTLRISLIDKARAPGGRMTSRRVKRAGEGRSGSDEGSVVVETGARVFQSTTPDFRAQCEDWRAAGLISEVKLDRLRGVRAVEGGEKAVSSADGNDETWWEAGKGGWTESLIPALTGQISDLAGDRLEWFYNTAAKPVHSNSVPTFEPPVDAGRPDIVVYTAPTPQIVDLFPGRDVPKMEYRKTFALIYPDMRVSSHTPIYWRGPCSALSAISTGILDNGESRGVVVQAEPEKLGVEYDKAISGDEVVKAAFERVMREAKLDVDLGIDLDGKDGEKTDDTATAQSSESSTQRWQLKRWKFAQVASPPRREPASWTTDDGQLVMCIGDGTSEHGGVQGGWESALVAAKEIEQWVERGAEKST